MDVLQLCAQKYSVLCQYTYDCTIARKNTSTDLKFTFSPYEFRHLAGLHRLENPKLRKNSERILKEILAGTITLETLRSSANWAEEGEKILLRLDALSQLDRLMDEFLLIFGFSGRKAGRRQTAHPYPDRRRLSHQVSPAERHHLFLFGSTEGDLLRAFYLCEQCL